MGLGSLAELTFLQPEAESLRESSSVESSLTWCLSSPPVTRSTWGRDIMTSYTLWDQLILLPSQLPTQSCCTHGHICPH